MQQAKAYASKLANDLTKITLSDFFQSIHQQYYPDQDIFFMEYFLELAEHEDQFVVPHSKLVEYGVMTSMRSNNVEKKLTSLGLENEVDYRLLHVSQPVKQGGFVKSVNYTLTPEAFKKCLMRAQRRSNQEVDPVIYCDYYLLLEKIYKLYTDYEREYSAKLMSMKDDKIDQLLAKVDQQEAKAKHQAAKAEQHRAKAAQLQAEQAIKIDRLLDYGNKITKQNADLIERTDHLQITADMTQDDLDKSLSYNKEILDHLVDKSYKSTMNPKNPDQVTHFAVLKPLDPENHRTILTRGQHKRVEMVTYKYLDTHEVLIDTTYNANAINLIINAKKRFEKERSAYIAEYNILIIEQNLRLKEEIAAYNRESKAIFRQSRVHREPRYISSEKKPLLTIRDIPIKFGTTFIEYEQNEHISYDKVIQAILDVNEETQMSPVTSVGSGSGSESE